MELKLTSSLQAPCAKLPATLLQSQIPRFFYTHTHQFKRFLLSALKSKEKCISLHLDIRKYLTSYGILPSLALMAPFPIPRTHSEM